MKSRFTFLLAASLCSPLLGAPAADLDSLAARASNYEPGADMQALREMEKLAAQSARTPATRPQIETALAQLLADSSTYEAKRFACQQLAIIGTERSLPALAALLRREETVGIACLALSTMPDRKADTVLVTALDAARGTPLDQIVNTLGDRRAVGAVPALQALARQRVSAAIAALGKIASPDALAELKSLRASSDTETTRTALEASLIAADRLAAERKSAIAAPLCRELMEPRQPLAVRRGALAIDLRIDPAKAPQKLLQALRSADAGLRSAVIAAVAGLKPVNTSALFARELPKLAPAEQVWLLEALAVRADPAARHAIRAHLDAADPALRLAAIRATGQVEGASAVPALTKHLLHPASPETAAEAEQALASLQGGTATDRAIAAALRAAPAEAKPRWIGILARRGNSESTPAVLAECGSDQAAVATAAWRALGRVADARHVPAVVDALVRVQSEGVRAEAEAAAEQVINKFPGASADVVLYALDHTQDSKPRRSLLRVLPAAGGVKALAAVQAAFRDNDAPVRAAAAEALANWPDDTAWDPLLESWRQAAGSAPRGLALSGLVRLAGEQNAKADAALVERYHQLLAGSRGGDEKKLVLSALGGAAHPDALKLVLPLLDDAAVKAEAAAAVRKIAEAIQAQHPEAATAALQRLSRP